MGYPKSRPCPRVKCQDSSTQGKSCVVFIKPRTIMVISSIFSILKIAINILNRPEEPRNGWSAMRWHLKDCADPASSRSPEYRSSRQTSRSNSGLPVDFSQFNGAGRNPCGSRKRTNWYIRKVWNLNLCISPKRSSIADGSIDGDSVRQKTFSIRSCFVPSPQSDDSPILCLPALGNKPPVF
jgi:hypothetical protein